MNTLLGNIVLLRPLEPTDLEFLYAIENDESLWEVSNTSQPFSRVLLKEYLMNAHRDIYDVKQMRLVIELKGDGRSLGLIDLFEFEPKHRRVGVGVLIFTAQERGKGYAKEALQLMTNFAFKHLNVHQVFANITHDNEPSIRLFEAAGFQKMAEKKDWIFTDGKFKDEYSYQLLKS